MKTTLTLLLVGLWANSAVCSIDPGECRRLLADSPLFQFERGYPEDPKSFRNATPDIYEKFIALLLKHSAHPFGLSTEVPVGTPLSVVLEHIETERNEIAGVLVALGRDAERRFRKGSQKIDKAVRGRHGFVGSKDSMALGSALESMSHFLPSAAESLREAYDLRTVLSQSSDPSPPSAQSLVGIRHQDVVTTARLLGPIANSIPRVFRELRVSFCVPRALVRHTPVWLLARSIFFLIDKNAAESLVEPERSFSVDLVFRDEKMSIRWGMIAPHDSTFSGSTTEPDFFVDRIRQTVAMRNKVSKFTPIHIFFVNGITAQAKKDIENLGVVVVGHESQ